MRSREEFLKWMYKKNNGLVHSVNPNDIYDYFNPPQSEEIKALQWNDGRYHWIEINGKKYRIIEDDSESITPQSEDVKERARSVAEKLLEQWDKDCNGVGFSESFKYLRDAITNALLSFNPSVEWPSEEEILNEIGKMSNPQRAVGFDLAINWLRNRIEKGLK